MTSEELPVFSGLMVEGFVLLIKLIKIIQREKNLYKIYLSNRVTLR